MDSTVWSDYSSNDRNLSHQISTYILPGLKVGEHKHEGITAAGEHKHKGGTAGNRPNVLPYFTAACARLCEYYLSNSSTYS